MIKVQFPDNFDQKHADNIAKRSRGHININRKKYNSGEVAPEKF